MDDTSVCALLTAESDAHNNTTSSHNAASVTDADKVINTKIDSAQVGGDQSEEELLRGLLADDYCHVCEAVLLFESQRLSHYEGKKHAQKVRVYLQAKKSEKMKKVFAGSQRMMTTDKDRFCELCNMVFSSHVVARSHYEGKVHTKNLRKQGLHPSVTDRCTEVRTLPSLTQDPDPPDQKSSPEGGMEHLQDPTTTTAVPSTEVDLQDPNKHCALCTASFNNPQMALQHYNGRKHQRNQAKQELLKKLGDNVQQANSLMCQMCSVQFNSVEMYEAHMAGNKHQIREKKVIDLCKSKQKNYGTFADELADYIQVQKARGITPKSSQVLPSGDTQKLDEDDEEEETLKEEDEVELNKSMPGLPLSSHPPHQGSSFCHYPGDTWRPSPQGPLWFSRGWDYNCPPPFPLCSGSPQFTSRPMKRKMHRKPSSSSSSYTTSSSGSSSYSSYSSSSSSDSDDSEHRRREQRKIRRSKRERGWRGRDEESDKEERRRRRKHRRRERDHESEERRREQSVESEEEGRRKKHHGKQRRKEKKSRVENSEVDRRERVMDKLKPEDTTEDRKETELHIQAEINVEQREDGENEPSKPKYRKDKKKTKEKVDTRTEEEKLWDDSILGC